MFHLPLSRLPHSNDCDVKENSLARNHKGVNANRPNRR